LKPDHRIKLLDINRAKAFKYRLCCKLLLAMGKIHFRNDDIERDIPRHLMIEYIKKDERGALCGYMRKTTTRRREQVTCFYCKQLLAHG
jgi:hypothetical protein